jgi:hypothetical protein
LIPGPLPHRSSGRFACVSPEATQIDVSPHTVFHVVKLMPVPLDLIEGRGARPPPPPEIIGGEERYKVEEVIDSRMRGRKLQYLVRWKGYGHEENLWIAEGDLDAPDLIADFYRTHPNAPKWINALIFGCMGFWPSRQTSLVWGFAHRDAAP